MDDTPDLIISAATAQEARRLADRHYPFVANSYDGGWAVTFPDLPGVMADAETWAEVGTAAHEALVVFIETQLALEKAVPDPSMDTEFLAVTTADYRRASEGRSAVTSPARFSTAEVAKRLEISPRRVTALASRRKVGRQVGRGYVFTEEDIQELRPGAPGQPPRRVEVPRDRDAWNVILKANLWSQLTMAKNWKRSIAVYPWDHETPVTGLVGSISTEQDGPDHRKSSSIALTVDGRFLSIPGDVHIIEFPSDLFDSTDPVSGLVQAGHKVSSGLS